MKSTIHNFPATTVGTSAFALVKTLQQVLWEMDDPLLKDELTFFKLEIDRASTDLALLKARLPMRKTTTELCSHFRRPI